MLLRYEAALQPMLDRSKRLYVVPQTVGDPSGALPDIANALDETLASVARRFVSPEIALRRLHDGAISIAAPMVVEAFRDAGFEPHGHEIIWHFTPAPADA